MNIWGICGLAGSGKDTAADFLVRNHNFVKVAFADPLKRICRDVFDFSEEQLWGPSAKRNEPDFRYPRAGLKGYPFMDPQVAADIIGPGTPAYLTPRYALQQLGTEWGRDCYPDIWVKYALRVAKRLNSGGHVYSATRGLSSFSLVGDTEGAFDRSKRSVVISDVRFENEIRLIKEAGGKVFRMLRGTGLEGAAGLHRSEQEMLAIPVDLFDHVIDNREWALEQLERCMTQLVEKYVAP